MKKNSTKRALVASILSMVLCCSMLLGTTFAWFTDSVTSTGNVITTGKLDVAMYWVEGNEDPNADTTVWADASKGHIFKNDKWEPGYVEAKHLKIANEGTLALKYQLRILANGVISMLADVIDVYYFDQAVQMDRADFANATKLGTLTEVLNVKNPNFISNEVADSLEAGESKIVTLAFKMQESAGNEYQELSLGSDFSIQILATQFTSEKDSFDNQYDADADFPPQEVPAAMVYAMSPAKLANITIAGFNGATLDTGYSFQPSETFEQASESEYEWAHADFFVYANKDVPAESMALAGYYTAFDGFSWQGETCTANSWIGLTSDTNIQAGEANGIRLLYNGMGIPGISYSKICQYGNDGVGFLCGASDLTGINEGTTLTVELRVYKVGACGNTDPSHHHNSFDCETGEYITIGKFQYTFDSANHEILPDGSLVEYADGGEIVLQSVRDVTPNANGEYYVPDGVTALNGAIFSANADVTTVVISDTVTDFGASSVSETNASSGAFKDSAVETVVLPEGMTTIPAAAFNGAKKLKSVNIPASVETIGVNAFRQTAIETLTIPATVETIEYGAFRDMTALTTVTIDGDVHIPNYAFRGCPNLRTVYINGENTTVGSNMAFANASSNNPGTNNITFYVKSAMTAAQVKACMGVGTNYWIYLDGQQPTIVKNSTELLTAIQNADGDTATIILANGTYSDNLDLTVAALGEAKCKNLVFKAAGDNVVFAGTVTIGYRQQNVGAASYGAKITFDGITFDHAETGKHCLNVQDVESFYMVNCTVIGDGEYGLSTPGSNGTGDAKIENCKFVNAGLQISGKFAQTLVIDGCEFEESVINVQGGGPLGPTIQNSKFDITLTAAHNNGSFYVIRNSNAGANIKVQNCEIKVDAEEGFTGVAGAKGWGVFVNRASNAYNIDATNVKITMTDAALAQTELKVAAIVNTTGKINMTDVTVNGVAQ